MNFASKSTGGWWKVWAYNRGHENDFNAGLQYCNTTGQHYIVYDIGCYTAAFDPFVYHGSFYPSDTTMADAYTDFYSTTLGIAHLGNTRNGLWVGGGPSFSLQQAFWVLFFADPGSPSAPAAALGAAEGLSKVAYQQNYVRHAHNLFGSPELEPWVISPDRMSVQAPSSIPQGVQVQFQVQVTHGQTGIPGVRVCLHKSGDIYQVGVTNSSGIVQFVVCAETPGIILITCTYPRTWIQQYLPHQKTCTVVPAFGDGPMGEVPQELGFTAVGPSPAFSGFTVQYGVPVQGRVRLQLHDVQGRVAVVVSDEELAPGYYRQDISKWALPLPAGVYFLALAQNGNRVTRKVTLVE
ncbi:MAG: T9SS type A sorting domain-containing protein [candidate division WOR-3 bacterium]|nr:MAG: T9SS type A sorting domain-containing protein [candidate division WOR-3 bacterium]